MRGARWGAVVLALLLVPAGACFDTSGLSGGTKDAGNFDDSAIASDAPLDTSSDTSAPVDASEEDSATPPSSTLVQERGSSASTTTSLDVSVAGVVTAGNSLLLVVSGVQETPTSVQGGGTWNKIASSGTHVATSMWLATNATGGSTTVTMTWTNSETTVAALLMEWTGTLTKLLDVETKGVGTAVSLGPITSAPGNVLIAGVGMHKHTVGAPSGGFTLIDSVTQDDLKILIAQSSPGAGTFSTGWTADTSDGWDAMLVALTGN